MILILRRMVFTTINSKTLAVVSFHWPIKIKDLYGSKTVRRWLKKFIGGREDE